jgi:calcium channel MID1
MAAYTDWLCSVVIPRCDDIPASEQASAQAVTAALGDNSTAAVPDSLTLIPESVQTLLIRSDPSLSRTPLLGPSSLSNQTLFPNSASLDLTTPFPYAETPPCSSLCYNVAASCPPILQWFCPVADQTLAASYGQLQGIGSADVQGGDDPGTNGKGGLRAQDRWGNVVCNSLGSDIALAVRGSASSSSLPSSMALAVPVVVSVILAVFSFS